MADRAAPLSKVLVIIPTYNEIENLDTITSRLRVSTPDAHILVVDDNSPDGTGRRADELAASDDHVHVLHRAGKEGLSAAYLAGMTWGLDRDYDVIVEFDADGSHQPEELPRVLDGLRDADMVKGSRWVEGGSVVNWPKSREYLSRGGSAWTRLMLGIPVKDITGGFNAFRADCLRAILPHVEAAGFGIQRDLTWHAHRLGYRIAEVPIEFRERELGNSKMGTDVVLEALRKTTMMGIEHRGGQARVLLGKLGSAAATASTEAGRVVGAGVHAVRTAIGEAGKKGS